MCKWTFACGALGLALAASAESAVEVTSVVQDATTKAVRVAYTLTGDAAIVTVDVKTNGVSIGAKNLWHFRGDVHRLVQPGSRTAIWQSDLAWPGHAVDAATFELKAWSQATPPDYMVVDLLTPTTVNYYTCADELPGGLGADIYREDKVVMRHIPAENVIWRMGSPESETGRRGGKTGAYETAHYVKLTSDYWIGVFEMTQRQYLLVAGTNTSITAKNTSGSTIGNPWHCPANNMSYNDLRGTGKTYDWPDNDRLVESESVFDKMRKLTGVAFDLPTEAQWEFACRAGTGTAYYNGEDSTGDNVNVNPSLTNLAWCGGINVTSSRLSPVGLLQPNAFGLYDMYANVWELCVDREIVQWSIDDPSEPAVDPVGNTAATVSANRIRKGASSTAGSELGTYMRSAGRHRMGRTAISWQTGLRLWAPIAVDTAE